jgi:hypothetical protein
MRFLFDECLHESLVGIAHAAGFEATHVNHLGLSGESDWALAARIIKDEFTFVTQQPCGFPSTLPQNGSAPRLDYPCSKRRSGFTACALGRCAPLLVRNGSGKHRD